MPLDIMTYKIFRDVHTSQDNAKVICQVLSFDKMPFYSEQNLILLKNLIQIQYLIIVQMQNSITVNVDFAGGLDLVFDNKAELKLQLPVGATVDTAIKELANKHANYKKEMFAINGLIRPGILVLVNDADWQLSDKQATGLENKDKISFISTLHGG